MARRTITLFMWAYQHSYRGLVERLAEHAFERLGISPEIKALLVGVRRPRATSHHPVCVEPEDGDWPLALFSGLPAAIEDCIRTHPHQNMVYGDEESMREKPENIRRDCVRTEVRRALEPYDQQHHVLSFCGPAYPVDDYYVVPVLQVPNDVFTQFPPLREPIGHSKYNPSPSFVHATARALLSDVAEDLLKPNPGRGMDELSSRAEKIVRDAAGSFLKVPAQAMGDQEYYPDLFQPLNFISSLLYEQTKGRGRLVLVNSDNSAINYNIRFATPVPFREHRWVRKVLQMASPELALIADSRYIRGLGTIQQGHDQTLQDIFEVDFLDHYYWQLRCGTQVLLRSRYGEPTLPQEPITGNRFDDNYSRLFPEASVADRQRIWDLFKTAAGQNHGSMIVVARDAASEVRRLQHQGTPITPALMTEELLHSASKVDGTIILDPHCICHAVGVILDGPAVDVCTPSRGARYNSGIRYICAKNEARMAIVVSDDGTVDVLPMLRPKIDRARVEKAVADLERANLDNWHEPRNFIDEHRFYLAPDQCERANAALDRIKKLPMDVGYIRLEIAQLTPHPAMNDSYYL